MGVFDSYLPDSAIEQPDIIGVAEANVIAQIPDYDTLGGDTKTYLESAVVCECCAALCPSMQARLPIQEQARYAHRITLIGERSKHNSGRRAEYMSIILSSVSPRRPFLPHFELGIP